jgi:hypothetical protein
MRCLGMLRFIKLFPPCDEEGALGVTEISADEVFIHEGDLCRDHRAKSRQTFPYLYQSDNRIKNGLFRQKKAETSAKT